MSSETNSAAQSTTGADAIDVAIASGIDFDGTPIPQAKLDLYKQVMGLEAGRQRSGVSNTILRSTSQFLPILPKIDITHTHNICHAKLHPRRSLQSTGDSL
jgi:hypothetical protein